MKLVVPFSVQKIEAITRVCDDTLGTILALAPKIFIAQQIRTDLKTAFVEAVANAAAHGDELKKRGSVEGRFFLTERAIGFEVIDHGRGFNIARVPVPDLADLAGGGRGVFMMKQLGDAVTYRKLKSRNILTFRRDLVTVGHTRELDLIYELSEAILRQAPLEEMCTIILNQALGLFNVERASILIYDETIKRLKLVASRGIAEAEKSKVLVRAGEGVSGYVFKHGRPLLIEDSRRDQRGLARKKGYKSRSFISAPMIVSPLRVNERPWGVINLTERKDGRKFTKKDLKLLSTIANQTMTCLYVHGLVDEAKRSDMLRRDVETVRRIQESYLPAKSPDIAGWDVAGRCAMAESAGGDYFDFIRKGYWLYAVIADVAGHNLASTMTMANFRAQLRALVNFEADPGKILTLLNHSLCDDLQAAAQFVSCVLLRIDTQMGRVEFANAGHHPPLFFRGIPHLTQSGLVIGIDPSIEYPVLKADLKPGDGLALYTDGAIEAMNAHGKSYGLEKLTPHLNAHHDARTIADEVVDDVLKFRSARRPADDVTVVVIRPVETEIT
jgi:sigma-B regulation protein RsbU (phosphoserine phosphatase)